MKLFSLKYILIIPFLLQLTGVVGLIGFLSFKNGEKSINELTNHLLLENASRVEDHLKYYTRFPN